MASTSASNGDNLMQQDDTQPGSEQQSQGVLAVSSKRARPAGGAAAAGQRRLFGSLTKTLSRFQEDTQRARGSEAVQRRAAVEERLAARLASESAALEAKSGREKQRRSLRMEILRKEDERSAFAAIHAVTRDNKTMLANFLCTKPSSPPSTSASAMGSLKPPPMPELPHALPPGSSERPLYYLPYKLLPWQADKIDGQVEDMKEALDAAEASWRAELVTRDAEIAELKKRLDEFAPEDGEEGGGARKRRRNNNDDAAHNKEREGSNLPERAPLPERDELEDDRGLGEDEDATMRAADADARDNGDAAEEEDVPACGSPFDRLSQREQLTLISWCARRLIGVEDVLVRTKGS